MKTNHSPLCSLKLELVESNYGVEGNGSDFGRRADLNLIFHSLVEVRKESNLPLADTFIMAEVNQQLGVFGCTRNGRNTITSFLTSLSLRRRIYC
ncbi:hypothetical protein LCGC14_0509260 [marine sediment metagenome]|uniref:Uncharacterized protein n=1 Tax=marine sediment metagenome TaxID=412755 RepID=A0A0F9S1P5_9ZZZZ|nr:hypothetical protein [bacterium]